MLTKLDVRLLTAAGAVIALPSLGEAAGSEIDYPKDKEHATTVGYAIEALGSHKVVFALVSISLVLLGLYHLVQTFRAALSWLCGGTKKQQRHLPVDVTPRVVYRTVRGEKVHLYKKCSSLSGVAAERVATLDCCQYCLARYNGDVDRILQAGGQLNQIG